MRRRTFAVTLLSFALLLWLLQWRDVQRGPSELGAYSDEPAHYVTGLMVSDYLRDALGAPPMEFAHAFYDRYPKVALGNWPPGFYLLQSAWTLTVGDDPRLLVLYIRLLAALTAALLAALVARITTPAIGVVAGLLWLCRPLTLASSSVVMTEVPLALATAAALTNWAALVARPSPGRATAWAALAAGAMLIKSSAIGLLALPLTARHLPWRVRGAALTVAVLVAAPWTLLFHDQASAGWLYAAPSWAYTAGAVPFYALAMKDALGWVGLAGVGLWIVTAIRAGTWGDGVERAAATATAASLAVLLAVPAGYEVRHTLPIAVPAVLLAALGVRRSTMGWGARPALVLGVLCAAVAAAELAIGGVPERRIQGYRAAVAMATAGCGSGCVLLVVSDPQGEGAVVAEAAALRRRVPVRVVRGSKVLSRSDWAGRDYQPLVRTAGEAEALMARLGLTHVLLDDAPAEVADAPAGRLVAAALRPTRTRLVEVRRLVRHPRHRLDDVGSIRIVDRTDALQ